MHRFRIEILSRIQNNSKFLDSPTQILKKKLKKMYIDI